MENSWFAVSQVIGLTIIHSLWQGLIVYALIRLLFFCFPAATSRFKYQAATGGLLVLTLWFLYTLYMQYTQVSFYNANYHPVINPVGGFPLFINHYQPEVSSRLLVDFNTYLPYITLFYAGGFIINLFKLSYSWLRLGYIKRNAVISPYFQIKIEELAGQFNLKVRVRAAISDIVDVPCVMGYFKPVLLLPFTLTTGLSAQETETILLHELAHISRNDFVWNLLRQLMTALLFFNPFTQLLGRIMDEERENSCDDIVVNLTGQPHTYAQALLKLETRCRQDVQLAMAATGKKYHLLNRIQRIMKTKKPSGNLRHLLFSLLIIGAGISSVAWLSPELKNGKLTVKISKPAIINSLLNDTTQRPALVKARGKSKKSKSIYITNKNNDPVLNKLTADVQKHAEKIGKYYSSPEFTRYAEEMGKAGAKLAEVYSTPEMQHLIEQQARLGADISVNMMDKAKQEQLNQQLEEAGKKFGAHYDTPEFKRLTEELTKASTRLAQTNVNNSAAYKKQMAEIQRLSQSVAKYSTSPAMKQAQEQMAAAALQIAKQYDSPELKQQQESIRHQMDSITVAFKDQNKELTDKRMKEIGARMKAYQQSSTMKQEQADLQKATKKLHEYMKSPAYQKWLKEQPEQKELKEQPERPEKKEQPELPEKQEQPETNNR